MSVINQMLVDLERRRASGEERNRIPDHVRALPDEPYPAHEMRLRIAAIAFVVALVGGGAWWWFAHRSVAPASVPVPIEAVSAPAAKPAAGPEPRDTEYIARRLTLDLARAPDMAASPVAERSAPVIDTAAVVRPRADAAPAEAPAEKPRVAPPPVQKKISEPVAAAVEIDKQMRKPTPRQRAEAEYSRGAAALHQGQSADARAAFESALQIDPSYHGARQALVGTLLEARQQADAMRVLQEGLQLAPAQQGFAMTLARLQLESGDLDAAAQTLARSVDYPDVTPDYIAFYASMLQRQQKHAEAATQFQRALSRRRNVGVWMLGLGVSLEALGRGPEALEAYRLAKSSGNLSADLQTFADQKLR